MEAVAIRDTTLRRLARADLDAVVDIDAIAEGRTRRPYFERRLAAALREPAAYVQFAAVLDDHLAGYVLARVLEGEFGRDAPAVSIEAIGARYDAKGTGVGRRLLDALADNARRRGIRELRTQARWNNHAMLRWLDENGFAVAANHIVDCAVAGGAYDASRDDTVPVAAQGAAYREIAYDGTQSNDFEHLARDVADIRLMRPTDLPDVVRIDAASAGHVRNAYMERKLAEAMHDSAICVSLVARVDDAIAGFLMARVDLGDFGRTEPVAVLDTIGVHPDYRHRRVGHALLSQLFVNLGGLRIERVETIVAPHDLELLGFLYAVGFAPSQRIPFARALG
jgi:ribosomal protein S18 acetylase RimI-like enzyme